MRSCCHCTVTKMRMQVIMQNDKDFMEVRLPYMQYLCWSTLLKQESVTEFSTYHFAPSLAAVNHNWKKHYYYYYYYVFCCCCYYYYYLFITQLLLLKLLSILVFGMGWMSLYAAGTLIYPDIWKGCSNFLFRSWYGDAL